MMEPFEQLIRLNSLMVQREHIDRRRRKITELLADESYGGSKYRLITGWQDLSQAAQIVEETIDRCWLFIPTGDVN